MVQSVAGRAAKKGIPGDWAARATRIVEREVYPALDRPNLTVRGDTTVDRVVVAGGRAVGIEVAGERIDAGEVVLCGGVLQSPALLRRSGIDRPGLGANLSDHPSVPVPVRLDAGLHAIRLHVRDRTGVAKARLLWSPPGGGGTSDAPIPPDAFCHERDAGDVAAVQVGSIRR